MHIVITGGAGFLGSRLARELLQRGKLTSVDGRARDITRLTLLDLSPARGFEDPRVEVRAGDVADPGVVAAAITPDTETIFHLAAVVSAQAEAELDLGMRVNLDATRLILERARQNGNRPRVVFTSSVAVFGGQLPARVLDSTILTPQSSYGTQKAMAELLLNDYSRRGLVDGRALRMPTISVRPGAPNRAASSFASGIIREPLDGKEAICPVEPATVMWLMSPGKAIQALLHGHELDGAAFGTSRSLNMPGLSITVGAMIAALAREAGKDVAALVRWQLDPALNQIVGTWPGDFATARAEALGFERDATFDDIVRAYMKDDQPGRGQATFR
jgi:nucleoside-diphosphate-sugar epimerase